MLILQGLAVLTLTVFLLVGRLVAPQDSRYPGVLMLRIMRSKNFVTADTIARYASDGITSQHNQPYDSTSPDSRLTYST